MTKGQKSVFAQYYALIFSTHYGAPIKRVFFDFRCIFFRNLEISRRHVVIYIAFFQYKNLRTGLLVGSNEVRVDNEFENRIDFSPFVGAYFLFANDLIITQS